MVVVACTRILCNPHCPHSRPRASQSGDEPGAMNSASLNTSAAGPFTRHVKVARPRSRRQTASCARIDAEGAKWRHPRFLATTLNRWTEQNVTVLGAPAGGLRGVPADDHSCKAPRGPARGPSSMIGYVIASGRHVSLVEQDGQASLVRVRVELVETETETVFSATDRERASETWTDRPPNRKKL